jgi:hypothetical protein
MLAQSKRFAIIRACLLFLFLFLFLMFSKPPSLLKSAPLVEP